MVEKPGGPQARALSQGGVNWILPPQLFEFLDQNGSESPEEVHLFGFSYLWHGFREMIEHLTEKSIVHIYIFKPFIEFGDDLASLGLESPASTWFTRRGASASRMTGRGDAEAMDDPAGLPIVAQWGRPGSDYFRMLEQIDGGDFQSAFVFGDSPTVLGRLLASRS